jgi:sulfate adenylyltransferase
MSEIIETGVGEKAKKSMREDSVGLIAPYRGKLVNLRAETGRGELSGYAAQLRSVRLNRREACDLELLATGAFSPLDGFMSQADHESVVETMRLADGTVFPIPITVSTDSLAGIAPGRDLALRGAANDLLAILNVEEVFEADRARLKEAVAGTDDPSHPFVAAVENAGRFNLSGKLTVLSLPMHPDFRSLLLTPEQTRRRLAELGRRTVVAFQTRNPLHLAHEELLRRAINITGGTLLLHPAVGVTMDGDVDRATRVRTYLAVRDAAFDPGRVLLAVVPLAMRMAGPREAVMHAIVRRNYGADHFIVGRDHASPGLDRDGRPFYLPSAAQELAKAMSHEIGVKVLSFSEFVYLPDSKRYEQVDAVPQGTRMFSLSGTRIREDFLCRGLPLPKWFTRPEVARILSGERALPPPPGVCLWLTGLSGSGKSTTAEVVADLLRKHGLLVTVLDGDAIRKQLSSNLGFSKKDRDTNVERIGFIAAQIVRDGGVAVCAVLSPYRGARRKVRRMFACGQFLEIFVDTPFDVCERRDPKGLYLRARRGELAGFTGIDDPYERPESPEMTLDTVEATVVENACRIVAALRVRGLLRSPVPETSAGLRRVSNALPARLLPGPMSVEEL